MSLDEKQWCENQRSVFMLKQGTLNSTLCMCRVKDDEEKLVIPFIPYFHSYYSEGGVAVASWLVPSTLDRAVWVRTLVGKIMLCC